MRLTPFAKIFITVVILGVLGYAFWHYKGGSLKSWATTDKGASGATGKTEAVSKGDFDALGSAPPDPERGKGSEGVSPASNLGGSGKLDRPLVVGINTWAGHSPGIVFNNGLDPNPGSEFKKKYGMDVKFVLLEDPASKLAAFRKGDVDIMWDTVDNWAREASILAEQNQKAKSFVMQDWSRGGDGIVSLASIKSIEELEGAQDRLHPVHPLALPPPLSARPVRPLPGGPRRGRAGDHLHPGRAGRRRHLQGQAGRRRRHLGARPLGRGDGARRRGARPGVDPGGDQHHRRHPGRPAGPDRPRPRHRARLRPRLARRDRTDQERPPGLLRPRRQGAEARFRHRLRHALGAEAHPLRRQRAVLRPRRRQAALSRPSSTPPSSSGGRRVSSPGRSRPRTGPTPASSRPWPPPTPARRSTSPSSPPRLRRRRTGRSSTRRSRSTSPRARTRSWPAPIWCSTPWARP